jgi:hypothetical protein
VNCGATASEKQILCPSRYFTFSHSQGQKLKSFYLSGVSVAPSGADIRRLAQHGRKVPQAATPMPLTCEA